LFFLFLAAGFANAYIDPGTGGMLIGSAGPIIGMIIAAIVGFISMRLIQPVKKKIAQFKEKLKEKNARKIVIAAVAVVALIAVAAVILAAVGSMNPEKSKRLIVIGIDAFDPKVVEKMMAEGKLENFRALSKEGSFGELESTIPPETPVAWSTAATGTNPAGFGIYDFINRDPKTYMPKLNTAIEKQGLFGTEYESAMKGEPFWRITSKNGIKTSALRWPITFPPENVNGEMLSGLGVVDVKGFSSGYQYYTTGQDPGSSGFEKVSKVQLKNGIIDAFVSGPRKIENGKIVEVKEPMHIEVSGNAARITVSGKTYTAMNGKWSDWIVAKFKIGFLNEPEGIFKAFIESTGPDFVMYLTTVQFNPERPMQQISSPSGFSAELAKEIGLYYTLGMPEETKGVTEGRLSRNALNEQIKEIEGEREKMFWQEFKDFDSGLLAFGFDSGDRLEHIFLAAKGIEGKEIPQEVQDYYIGKDRFLGELLQKKGDAEVIIFSDHGFNSFEKEVSVNTWLVDNGYMAVTRQPSKESAGELFSTVDWSRTRAYSLGFNSIYINLKGREGKGIVEEKDREALIGELVKKLKEWKNPQNGENVMKNVYKSSEIYSGDFISEAPDIITGTSEGYRLSWQNAVGGLTPEEVFDNNSEWIGEHLMDRDFVPAVLFTSFRTNSKSPKMTDIAPTVLDYFGIAKTAKMQGSSLFADAKSMGKTA